MNDVRLHVPYIFGNQQNSNIHRESEEVQKAQLKTEKFGIKRRPTVGQDRPERGNANFMVTYR